MRAGDALKIVTRSTVAMAYLGAAVVVGLLTIPLAVTTVQAIWREDQLNAASRALARGGRDALDPLLALRKETRTATASVMLGAFKYERAKTPDDLEEAERLFAEALEAEPGRNSAVLGLVSARLRRAEAGGPDALKKAAAEAEPVLAQANDPEHPDVVYLRGALQVLLGKAKEGEEVLAKDPSVAPTRAGQAARWWNLAVARFLVERDPLSAAVRAFTLRPDPLPAEASDQRGEEAAGPEADPARLLRAAYRYSLADEGCQPNTPEALRERAELAWKTAWLRFSSGHGVRGGQYGRYAPHRDEAGEVLNALGQALFRLGDHDRAVTAFREACDVTREKEPLYLLNLGQAAALAYRQDKEVNKERRSDLLRHSRYAFDEVAKALRKQKGRASLLKLAVDNRSTLFYDNNPREGVSGLQAYKDVYPSESEWNRNMGTMLDWIKRPDCVKYYKKSAELGHPDSSGIQERVRLWEQVSEGKGGK
ncbi:MAG: tetratricopeptide repeat protein [Planctomycetota bacterium]